MINRAGIYLRVTGGQALAPVQTARAEPKVEVERRPLGDYTLFAEGSP